MSNGRVAKATKINPEEFKKKIQNLEESGSKIEKKDYDPKEHRDKTRSKIALVFVWAFFITIGATVGLTMIYNSIIIVACKETEKCLPQLLSVKDMLLAVIGYVGSPLGFVIGYYFKGNDA